jgi:hypothetical protein
MGVVGKIKTLLSFEPLLGAGGYLYLSSSYSSE